jgi:hypothetical protein
MKTRYIFFALIAVAVSGPHAKAGGWVSGGGDGVAQEFISFGYRVYDFINTSSSLKAGFSLEDMKSDLDEVTVETKDNLFLLGVEKDAINYPAQKKIEVSRTRWQSLSGAQKASLALHEYLGIRFSDRVYELSAPILTALARSGLEEITAFTYRCVSSKPMDLAGYQNSEPIIYIFNIGKHIAWINLEGPDGKPGFATAEKCTRHTGDSSFALGKSNEEIHCGGERGFLHVNIETWPDGHEKHFVNIALLGKGYGENEELSTPPELHYYTAPLTCKRL